MAKRRPYTTNPTTGAQEWLPSADALDAKINVSGPNALLGRITSGEGGHEELTEAGITEETTPAAGDFLVGFVGGAIRKMDVGNLPGGGETVISPSSLSTDQNDWSPTSLSTATVIRITSSVNLLMITGIAAPSAVKELTIVNIGSNTILLTSDDPSSSAANRFTFGRDGALFPNRSVKLFYDLTSARWRMIDKISEEYSNARATRHKYVFSQNLFNSYGSVSITANGGITLSSASATLPNGVAGTTGTTNGNFVSFRIGNATYTSGNVSSSTRTSILHESCILTPSSLADATTNYTIMAGIGASDNSTTGQGFRLQYNYNVNGGRWQGITNNGSSATVDTGITVAASTVYKLTCQCRPDNSVAFWINDVYVGETTTNLPTQPVMSETLLKLSTGGTSRTLECYSVEMVQIR